MKSTDRFPVEGVLCTVHGRTLSVINLSVGGFFAAAESLPPLGELLDLELALQDRPVFRVVGKVIWLNEGADPRAPDLPRGFGFRISRIAMADKLAIVDFLKRAVPARPPRAPLR